jgi:hypothetical protein
MKDVRWKLFNNSKNSSKNARTSCKRNEGVWKINELNRNESG